MDIEKKPISLKKLGNQQLQELLAETQAKLEAETDRCADDDIYPITAGFGADLGSTSEGYPLEQALEAINVEIHRRMFNGGWTSK